MLPHFSFNSLENGLNMCNRDSVDNIRDLSYCTKNFTCLIHSIQTHFFFIFLCWVTELYRENFTGQLYTILLTDVYIF